MKKVILLACTIFFCSQFLSAQPITCNGGSFEVTSVVCSNDLLTFTVTNLNASSCSAIIVLASPDGVVVTGQAGIGNVNQLFFYDGMSTISIPNIGCQPLMYTLQYIGACTNCIPAPFTLTASAPIPTIGQWSIIMVAICLLIFGVISYKSVHVTSRKVVN